MKRIICWFLHTKYWKVLQGWRGSTEFQCKKCGEIWDV